MTQHTFESDGCIVVRVDVDPAGLIFGQSFTAIDPGCDGLRITVVIDQHPPICGGRSWHGYENHSVCRDRPQALRGLAPLIDHWVLDAIDSLCNKQAMHSSVPHRTNTRSTVSGCVAQPWTKCLLEPVQIVWRCFGIAPWLVVAGCRSNWEYTTRGTTRGTTDAQTPQCKRIGLFIGCPRGPNRCSSASRITSLSVIKRLFSARAGSIPEGTRSRNQRSLGP